MAVCATVARSTAPPERVLSGTTADAAQLDAGRYLSFLFFCLFLVDNAGLLALFALSFCNLRMGLLVGLWNHILGFRLLVGHNSPPVSGVNVTNAGSVPVRSRRDDRRRRPTLSELGKPTEDNRSERIGPPRWSCCLEHGGRRCCWAR